MTNKTQDLIENAEYQYNEINQYINARYISAPEACHRLFEYKMQAKSHVVSHLAIHLPEMNNIYFESGNEEQCLNKNTTLTAWFDLNKKEISAHQYKYTEIYNHYTFDNKNKTWQKRKYGN